MDNRLEWELNADLRFTKTAIMQYIDDLFEREDPANDELWQRKLKTPNIQYYMKKGGSELDPKCPYMRFEMVFPKPYKMNKLLKVITPPELLKWETNMRFSSKMMSESGSQNYFYIHGASKKNFGISSRDWYDKVFQFEHNGTIYKFVSTVANSEDKVPVPDKDTIRALNYFSCIKIHRNPENQKIHYEVITQSNFKLQIPDFILKTALPNGSKKWMAEAQKFYSKNHKNL